MFKQSIEAYAAVAYSVAMTPDISYTNTTFKMYQTGFYVHSKLSVNSSQFDVMVN